MTCRCQPEPLTNSRVEFIARLEAIARGELTVYCDECRPWSDPSWSCGDPNHNGDEEGKPNDRGCGDPLCFNHHPPDPRWEWWRERLYQRAAWRIRCACGLSTVGSECDDGMVYHGERECWGA